MRTHGQAILWQISWRWRWGLLAAAAYLLTASVLSHLLPKTLNIRFGDEPMPAVAWFLGVPSIYVNIMLVAVFSISGRDLRESGFTTHMFVLPVRTRTLVAWPMFTGCLTVMLVWLIIAALVFRPGGIAAPLWWPAAAMAYFLVSFQAVCWTPFAQRWMHVAVTVAALMLPFVAFVVFLSLDLRMSEPMIALLLIGAVPVAFAAALSGVARARRGDPYDWRLWSRMAEWVMQRRSRAGSPFSSWNAAQIWFECRAHVWTVPIVLGCTLMCFLFLPAIDRHNVALGWRLFGSLIGAPLFIAVMTGGALGNLHAPFSRSDTDTFLLTRPISSVSLVRAKLIAAAVSTAAIWVIMLAFASLLLVRPGLAQSIAAAASQLPLWKAIGLTLLALGLLVALTWKNMIENLWIALTGRPWVAGVNNVGLLAIGFGGGGVGVYVHLHPEVHGLAWAAVPWLIGLLLAAKLALATIIVRSLDRSRLVDRSGIARMIGIWMLVVAALCLIAFTFLPTALASPSNIVPGIALFTPFSRLAGAPLALAWNRHR
jgi:hypothetical protein